MTGESECLTHALMRVFGEDFTAARAAELLLSPAVRTADFADGEILFGDASPRALGILVRGGAEIVRSGAGGEVLLRTLRAGDVFGAAAIFAKESAGTAVRARGSARAVFLSREAVEAVLAADARAARGYIAFLSAKIEFLNARLAIFTAESAEARLAGYLLRATAGGDTFTPELSLSRTADLLGLGRASLYRALDALAAAGAIEKKQKNIYIKNRAYLARVSGGTK